MSEENFKYKIIAHHGIGYAEQEGSDYDNIDDAVNIAKYIKKENKDSVISVEVIYE